MMKTHTFFTQSSRRIFPLSILTLSILLAGCQKPADDLGPLILALLGGGDNSSDRCSNTKLNFKTVEIPEVNSWESVHFAMDQYIAMADKGTNRIMTSPNGLHWTTRQAGPLNEWSDIASGNNLLVTISRTGTNRVMISLNGAAWTAIVSEADGNTAPAWESIVYANGQFVALGRSTGVLTSPDGLFWTRRSTGENNGWSAVTYGNGIYVGVGGVFPSNDTQITSLDGMTWESSSSGLPQSPKFWDIVYGKGVFVAVGDEVIAWSQDGRSWTEIGSPVLQSTRVSGITYGDGLFVAVGYTLMDGAIESAVLTSPDGKVWTQRSIPVAQPWTSVTYEKGRFVAVADDQPYATNLAMYADCD